MTPTHRIQQMLAQPCMSCPENQIECWRSRCDWPDCLYEKGQVELLLRAAEKASDRRFVNAPPATWWGSL